MKDSDLEIEIKNIVKPLAIFDNNDENQHDSSNQKQRQNIWIKMMSQKIKFVFNIKSSY